MNLISFQYLIFVAILFVLYYLLPKKVRWYVLLAGSVFYYIFICKWYSFFLLFTILSTFGAALLIQHMLQKQQATVKSHKEDWDRETRKKYNNKGLHKRMAILALGVVLNFAILAFLKYIPWASSIGLLLPLGISFYSFQSTGYLIDVYREDIEPEKNILRYALFVSFFPQIIQGPISKHEQLAEQLYEGHSFDWERIQKALLLILWGLMKKLVVADRAVNIINTVMDAPQDYSGSIILFTGLTYALQLYADFSGGIDIIRGVGELFGITMTDNFRRPYFARTLTEYWHRWHITLGDWCRNYIFYPLSISKTSLNFGKWLKPKFGAHIAKVLPGSIASLITFIVIGVWHGSNLKYLYFGLWNGIVILLAELFAPFFAKVKLNRGSTGYTFFAVIRTFILVLVGYYFDIVKNARVAFSMLGRTFSDFHISDFGIHRFREIMSPVGLDKFDYWLLIVCAIGWFFISLYQEKHPNVEIRANIMEKSLPKKWLIIFAGIFFVLLMGYYGPGTNPADFVYMQF